jgi:hypothetical protein
MEHDDMPIRRRQVGKRRAVAGRSQPVQQPVPPPIVRRAPPPRRTPPAVEQPRQATVDVECRQRVQRRQRVVASLRAIDLHDGRGDFTISHVNIFPDGDCIALCVTTPAGTVNLLLPHDLACKLGDGLVKLTTEQAGARRR